MKAVARFKAWLRHAFSTAEPPLTPQERRSLDDLAADVRRRKLTAAALIAIESSRPLNFVASQSLAFLEPFVAPLLSEGRVTELARALEKRASVDYLIAALEAPAEDKPPASPSPPPK